MKKTLSLLAVLLALPLSVRAADAGGVAAELSEHNQAFALGLPSQADLSPARIQALAAGQHPKAIVLSCADSRVPPEHVFRQGLGELFVVRVAGNVATSAEIASIEYAVEHLHVPNLVVLGHTSCGAVAATAGEFLRRTPLSPSLRDLVEEIMPSIRAVVRADPSLLAGRSEAEVTRKLAAAAVPENARLALQNLLRRSEIVRHAVETGELTVHVGVYDVASGLADLHAHAE